MMDENRLERIEGKIDQINIKMGDISGRIIRLETVDKMKEYISKNRKQSQMQWIAIASTLAIVLVDLFKIGVL